MPAQDSELKHTLWPGMKALEPTSQLGGIYAPKTGYHDTISGNPKSDYSVQLPQDTGTLRNKAAAIDWTFPEAHSGNYKRIRKYSDRIDKAFRAKDKRVHPYWREYYGHNSRPGSENGFDNRRHASAWSDRSHDWHIHLSCHRDYINDQKVMRGMLSVLKGESYATWVAKEGFNTLKEVFDMKLSDIIRERIVIREGKTLRQKRSVKDVLGSADIYLQRIDTNTKLTHNAVVELKAEVDALKAKVAQLEAAENGHDCSTN